MNISSPAGTRGGRAALCPAAMPAPWRRYGKCLLAALLLLVALSAPLNAQVVVDLPQADGSILQLQQPARRIITLSPHLTELAFAAGIGDRIVGTVSFSDYPPEALSLPRIGDAFRLDLEQILSLQPDLVIAWFSGNPRQAVTRLQELGLTTWSIEIRDPGGIAATLRWLGQAGGAPDAADAAADKVTQRLQRLAGRYTRHSEVTYFYQVASRPLFTINQHHLIAQGLALCGGRNVFASQSALAPQVSREAVIAASPQAMFAPTVADEALNPLAEWRDWPIVPAIRSESLYLLPADEISRATPRLVNALEQACRQLDRTRAWHREHANGT